jgi:hypothetical protein
MPVMTYREALRSAMADEMERDDAVVVIGEDIGVYGGTHLVTDTLLDRFGPKRVIDTPISEGGFTGAAIGMAMMGMRPIVEMMTWNFSFQAVDQILQNAAKLRYFSGGQAGVPMVIRGPNGGGVQLSAQHTHSLEGFYGHFPGLKVVSPVTPHDAKGMMLTAIRDPDPVIFLEAGALYGTKGEVPEGEVLVPFGKARIAREGTDVTLVGYASRIGWPKKTIRSRPRSSTCAPSAPLTPRRWSRRCARRTARWWCRSSGDGTASPPRWPPSSRSRPSTTSTPRWSASAAQKCPRPTPATWRSPPSPASRTSSTRFTARCTGSCQSSVVSR